MSINPAFSTLKAPHRNEVVIAAVADLVDYRTIVMLRTVLIEVRQRAGTVQLPALVPRYATVNLVALVFHISPYWPARPITIQIISSPPISSAASMRFLSFGPFRYLRPCGYTG